MTRTLLWKSNHVNDTEKEFQKNLSLWLIRRKRCRKRVFLLEEF